MLQWACSLTRLERRSYMTVLRTTKTAGGWGFKTAFYVRKSLGKNTIGSSLCFDPIRATLRKSEGCHYMQTFFLELLKVPSGPYFFTGVFPLPLKISYFSEGFTLRWCSPAKHSALSSNDSLR